jgi:hypothetical protein
MDKLLPVSPMYFESIATSVEDAPPGMSISSNFANPKVHFVVGDVAFIPPVAVLSSAVPQDVL